MPPRNNATGRVSRTSPTTASGRSSRSPTRQVFLFAGQSNMSAYTPMITLAPTGSVPGYARTAINEWTGASPVSVDTSTAYQYPTEACLYQENVNGVLGDVFDGWGTVLKQYPKGSGGTLQNAGRETSSSFGLEMTFIQRHVAVYPTIPVGAVKCSLGGTGLAADWLAANTGSNNTGTDRGQWTIFKTMIQQAAARLNNAGAPWRWGGFVWMQGESGAHTFQTDPTGATDNTYLSDARLFFAAVRGLTRSDMPVIVGRIDDAWGWETTPNAALVAYGNEYLAIDYSITSSAATVNSTTRARALAGAVRRRATQVTLGTDSNCAWFNNDGYPRLPPVSLTAASTDLTGYHWGGPGVLTAGERAFTAFNTVRN